MALSGGVEFFCIPREMNITLNFELIGREEKLFLSLYRTKKVVLTMLVD